MSNGVSTAPLPAQIPLQISIAPFPIGFSGDMDETFQQATQLMKATVVGNFITGVVLPPGSTLPTTNIGVVFLNGVWYYWDPNSNQYLAQTQNLRLAKNYVKNCIYQIQQTGPTFTLGAGITKTYDLAQPRSTLANVLAIASDVGPAASGDSDQIGSAIKYTVGPSVVTSPGATDIYAHEHLIEGCDLAPLQGQILALSLFVYLNQAGTYSVYMASSGRDASYVANFTVATANSWYRIKLNSIPKLPTGSGTWQFGQGQTGLYIGVAMCVGSQFLTAAPNTWLSGFFAGTSQNQNYCSVVNNQIKITGLKLEGSASVTYLTVPSFESDLHDVIRYYWTGFNYQSQTAGVPCLFVSSGTNTAFGSLVFPRIMAQTPIVIPYSWANKTAGYLTDLSTNTDVPLASMAATSKGAAASVTVTSTKGDVLAGILTADARLS